MNRTLLFITALFVLIFMSCQSTKKNNAERQNEVELVAEKQLAFPLDEQTYYLSISIYQFEENGKEYLHFENTRKSLYDIVIFDIENKQIAKRIPLHKTGPNGLPAVYGSRPSPDSKYILIAQNDISRLSSINDKGEVIRNYDFQPVFRRARCSASQGSAFSRCARSRCRGCRGFQRPPPCA